MRPIKRLARTAYNLGIGKDIKNIPISGASEVRLATRAVISMASRIRNQMNDRTEMLAGVSHDLRTPLTRLRLQIAMLPKTPEIVSMTKDLEEMENMISEYLSFAKNSIVEPMSEVNLNNLFHPPSTRYSITRPQRSNLNIARSSSMAILGSWLC